MNHIHLEWKGPFTWAEAKSKESGSGMGIYQIYGCHALYGSDVLLYIGKAELQKFRDRLKQEKWWQYNPDPIQMRVYLGQVTSKDKIDRRNCEEKISLAEKLLIYAHRPLWNAQKNIDRKDAAYREAHVFNWGNFRSLLPEVSGARWGATFDSPREWPTYPLPPLQDVQKPTNKEK